MDRNEIPTMHFRLDEEHWGEGFGCPKSGTNFHVHNTKPSCVKFISHVESAHATATLFWWHLRRPRGPSLYS